ncbi:exosortase B [Iodobacter sp. HSC-16F04]|uniref:Exosortase B n=1 Tax=Iodobacter violaceini TaxID=3044271 RepID=A0ABX0KNC4_9NEIS|nr:exosortase B [Iodobacter violacea]NHQ85940.1 exosortase B [Iodobacter violacea]
MSSLLARYIPESIVQFIRLNYLLILGFSILCIPTIADLSQDLWQTPEQGHGPFILAIILWLFYKTNTEGQPAEVRSNNIAGAIIFFAGALSYILGRSQEIWLFEVGAFIPMLCGLILLISGSAALKKYFFAISFIVFLIPLPGVVVDALTSGLKSQVSHWAEVLLYAANYPVARSGVMLVVGQYQLLVADACSGMNSLFSLFALGLLYIHIGGYGFSWRGIVLFLCVVPIAFIANVIRVMILILVTYHFGDAAGQGFIHSFAGMVVFAVALIAFFITDFLLGLIFVKKAAK